MTKLDLESIWEIDEKIHIQFWAEPIILYCCPASPDEEDLGAAGLLLRTYSAGPVSPICYDLKGPELLRAATLGDLTTPTPVICVIRVWQYATFIVFASSSSG
jgi:hypothetical protein